MKNRTRADVPAPDDSRRDRLRILLLNGDARAATRLQLLLEAHAGENLPPAGFEVLAQGPEGQLAPAGAPQANLLVVQLQQEEHDEPDLLQRARELAAELPVVLLDQRLAGEDPLPESAAEGSVRRVAEWEGAARIAATILQALGHEPDAGGSSTPSADDLPFPGTDLIREGATEASFQKQLDQLAVLHAVAVAGTETNGQDALIEQATEIIGSTLYPDNFGVLLLNAETGQLHNHRSYRGGSQESDAPAIPLGKGICGVVAAQGTPWLVPDVTRASTYIEVDPETRSELCVPLRVEDRVLGVINAESRQVNAFTAVDERFLVTLASQLAHAIENTRLIAAERTQRLRVEALERIARALSSTLDLQDLLNLICQESLQLFAAHAAFIWLVQGEHLVGFAGFGAGFENFIQLTIPLDDQVTLGARVIREQRAIYVNHARTSDQVNPELISLLDVEAVMGVPLIKGDAAIGALMILNMEDPLAFETRDLESARVLSIHAALAIENARLFEAERSRRQEAETLRQATAGLTASLDQKDVLDRILHQLELVVPYDSACIFLFEEQHLHAVAGRNFPEPEKVVGRDYSLEGDVLSVQIRSLDQAIILEDAQADPRFHAWGGATYIHGWMGVPLRARGEVIGVMTLDSREVGAYAEKEASLAQALANQAALAIDNARLFEDTQRQALALAGLYETALMVSSVLVTDALLARLREQVLRLHKPDSFGLFLYQPDTETFEISLAVEGSEDIPGMAGIRVPVDQGGLTGWVIRSRSPLLIADTLEQDLPVAGTPLGESARAWLGVPLIARDQLLGAISLQALEPDSFSLSDQRYLESLAAQVAIALENARLYEEAHRGITRQEALNAVIAAAAASTDLHTLLASTLDQAVLATGLRAGFIWVGEHQAAPLLPPHIVKTFRTLRPSMEGIEEGSVQTIAVADWSALPADHPFFPQKSLVAGLGFRASLHVAVVAEELAIGELVVFAPERHSWSREEISLLEAIGQQIGSAVVRLELFELTQHHAEMMERLVSLSETLNRPLTVQEVYGVIGRSAMSLSGAGQATLFLRGPQDQITCPWQFEISTEYVEMVLERLQEIPGGKLLGSTDPVLVSDLEELGGETPIRRIAAAEGIHAYALWPLVYEGQVIAAVGCYFDEPRRWQDIEINVMSAFGRQAAIALQNARLLDDARDQAEKMGTLVEIGREITTKLELESLLDLINHRARQLTGADRSLILLVDSPSQSLVEVMGQGFEPGQLEGVSFEEIAEGISGWVLANGQATLADDLVSDPRIRGAARERLVRDPDPRQSLASAPLLLQNRAVGTLSVIKGHEKPPFSPTDLNLVVMLASQAAVALENARLFEAERKRGQELEALRQASLKLTSSLELHPVLETILDQTLNLVAADNAHIFLFDGEVLSFGAAMNTDGLLDRPVSEPRDQGITYTVARSGERVLIQDASDHPLTTDRPWHGALIGLPLRSGDQVRGVMNVAYREPHAFQEDELRILALLADQAAVALENARAFSLVQQAAAETRQKVQDLTTVFDVSQALAGASLNSEQIAKIIALQIMAVLDVPACAVSLVDTGRRTLRTLVDLAVGQAVAPGERSGREYGYGESSLLAHALNSLQPTILEAERLRDQLSGRAWAKHDLTNHVVLLPLVVKGKPIGLMELAASRAPDQAYREQLNLAMTLANQAAVALENARLFEELHERVSELSAISEVSASLRGAVTAHDISQTLALETTRLLGARRVILYLNNQTVNQLVAFGIANRTGPLRPLAERKPATDEPEITLTPDISPEAREVMVFSAQVLEEIRLGAAIPLRTSTGEAMGLLLIAWDPADPRAHTLLSQEHQRLLTTLAEIAANALQRARSHEELEGAYLQTVLSLARAMDVRDTYTGDHSQRIANMAEAIAEKMDCSEAEIQAVRWAALLHDIGKIGVPDSILLKPGPLTDDEWMIMKRHPEIGAEIISPVDKLADVVPIVRAHQEKHDGSGYPDGLGGEDIPLGARIMAVADAYSAITDDRVYRQARSHEEALAELQRCAGTQFDPAVVKTFLQVIAEQPERLLPHGAGE